MSERQRKMRVVVIAAGDPKEFIDHINDLKEVLELQGLSVLGIMVEAETEEDDDL